MKTKQEELSPSVKSVSSVVKNPVSLLSDTFETVPPSAARSRVNAELRACYNASLAAGALAKEATIPCRGVVPRLRDVGGAN